MDRLQVRFWFCLHKTPAHIIFTQDALFRVLVIWMMHGKKTIRFPYFRLLVRSQPILFRKLGDAFHRQAAFAGRRTTLGRLTGTSVSRFHSAIYLQLTIRTPLSPTGVGIMVHVDDARPLGPLASQTR